MLLSLNGSLGELPNALELSPSEWHQLLADEQRRLTIAFLIDRPNSIGLEELATEIATSEIGSNPDSAVVDRVAMSLHHVHLPKLDQGGVLDYDPDTHQIVPVERL